MPDASSPEFAEPQGISLNELTQAYAQAMGSERKADGEPRDTEDVEDAGESDDVGESNEAGGETLPFDAIEGPTAEDTDDGVAVTPTTVVETLLFVGSVDNRPLESAKAADLMRGVTPGDVAEIVDQLNERYRANGCPYKIASDGDGYRMVLRRTFHPVRNKFYGKVREARLSQAAIDTLAIVAYRQPLTSEQVTQLRGTPSGHLLTQLVRRQLLEVEPAEGSRRNLYRTSARFLELFGLESLQDLPDSD